MTKSCKYGHGDLTEMPGIWALSGIAHNQQQSDQDQSQNFLPTGIYQTNHVYTLTIHQCQRCGYVELFDLVVHHE